MAQELYDGEFWLPSEFLTDDDLLTDFKTNCFSNSGTDAFLYGTASKSGFDSDLSSPVEPLIGSTETESDEDDFITGLTRKIDNSTLQDSTFTSDYTTKGGRLSSSPQSTLYGCKPDSSRSSPNCVSQVSSPPDAKDTAGWNFLYAAAEEVARMRMIEETSAFYSDSLYGPTHKHNQVSGPLQNPNPLSGPYQNQAQSRLSYKQLQETQFQLMKQQEMQTSGVWGQENTGYQFQNGRRNVGGTPGPLMPSWPTPQQSQQLPQPLRQRTGACMRAVFLGETGARKERTGTGVFLPRRFENNLIDARKKPGCSVLLPDKVVHALNLNLDSIDSSSHPSENLAAEYGSGFNHRNNVKFGQQMKSLRPPQQHVVKQELGLPQEWTY